jgi:hypothetical protein
LLKRLGFTADVANDGLEAVEAWHKKNYDVIVRSPAQVQVTCYACVSRGLKTIVLLTITCSCS